MQSTDTSHAFIGKRENASTLRKGTDNMIMQCINHHYREAKGELQCAHQRLLNALRGIPVQFRSGEMSGAIREMECVDIDDVDSIKAHAQRAIDAVGNTPIQYITNEAVDAARQFQDCLSAF